MTVSKAKTPRKPAPPRPLVMLQMVLHNTPDGKCDGITATLHFAKEDYPKGPFGTPRLDKPIAPFRYARDGQWFYLAETSITLPRLYPWNELAAQEAGEIIALVRKGTSIEDAVEKVCGAKGTVAYKRPEPEKEDDDDDGNAGNATDGGETP